MAGQSRRPQSYQFREPQYVSKKWGYETVITNEMTWKGHESIDGYTGKILTVIPNNFMCSVHYHVCKTETFYILRGKLHLELYVFPPDKTLSPPEFTLEDIELVEELDMCPGQAITIKPYTPHRFWAEREVAEFIGFSTLDDPKDSYRIIPSQLRDGKDIPLNL